MPKQIGRRVIRNDNQPVQFSLNISGRPLSIGQPVLGGDTEPFMESLILAQNERWRRA